MERNLRPATLKGWMLYFTVCLLLAVPAFLKAGPWKLVGTIVAAGVLMAALFVRRRCRAV